VLTPYFDNNLFQPALTFTPATITLNPGTITQVNVTYANSLNNNYRAIADISFYSGVILPTQTGLSLTLYPSFSNLNSLQNFVTPDVGGFLNDPQVGDTFPLFISLSFPPTTKLTYSITQNPSLISYAPNPIIFNPGQTVASTVATVTGIGIASTVLYSDTPGFANIVVDQALGITSSRNNLGLITFTNMPISLYLGESYWVKVNRNYFYANTSDTLNFGVSGGSSSITFSPANFNAGDQFTYINVTGTGKGTAGFITLNSPKYFVETRHINVGKFLTILNNVIPSNTPQEVFLYCPTDEAISFSIIVSGGLRTDYGITTLTFSRALPVVGLPVWGGCGQLIAVPGDSVPRVSYAPAAYEGAFKFNICG